MFKTLKNILAVAVSISLLTISNAVADGHGAAIKKWSNGEFSLSTISAKEREKELNWFHNAAKPFKGMEINVLSETIPTHEYESKVLRPKVQETTALGAAFMAGLYIGVYKSLKDISKNWQLDKKFSSKMKNSSRNILIDGWEKAVKRALIN